jgi:hypothetical protein
VNRTRWLRAQTRMMEATLGVSASPCRDYSDEELSAWLERHVSWCFDFREVVLEAEKLGLYLSEHSGNRLTALQWVRNEI